MLKSASGHRIGRYADPVPFVVERVGAVRVDVATEIRRQWIDVRISVEAQLNALPSKNEVVPVIRHCPGVLEAEALIEGERCVEIATRQKGYRVRRPLIERPESTSPRRGYPSPAARLSDAPSHDFDFEHVEVVERDALVPLR